MFIVNFFFTTEEMKDKKRRMKLRFFILLLLLFPYCCGWTQGSYDNIKNEKQLSSYYSFYTVQDGLAQNTVMDMIKEKNGFLWIVSKNGLSRFDGYDFKNFKASSKELQRSVSNQFLSMKRDACGCFWILNDIGQVLRFDPTTESFSLYPSADENRGDDYFSTGRMLQLNDNEIWLLGTNAAGAIRLTIDTLSSVQMDRFCFGDSSVNSEDVRSVFLGQNDKRWLLTNKGLFSLQGRDTVLTTFPINGTNPSVYSMIESPNELIVSSVAGVVYKYEKTKRRMVEVKLPTQQPIVSLYLMNDSYCCALTQQNQMFVFRLLDNAVILSKEFDSSFEKCWKDLQGDLLFTVKNETNVYVLDHNTFSIHKSFLNDYDEQVSITDTMGVIWSAKENSGVIKTVFFNESFQHVAADFNRFNRKQLDVTALWEDDMKRLWVASKDGSLSLFDVNSNRIGYVNSNGEIQNSPSKFALVSFLYQDRKGKIWVATDRSLLCLTKQSDSKYQVAKCESVSDEFSPLSYEISDLLEDSKGHLWLATRNGGLHLLQSDEKGYRFIHKENLLKNTYPPTVDQSHALMEDSQGNIWLGSSEGLTIFSSDFDSPENIRFFFYNTENTNLTNSCIYDIYQDQKGNIWMASYGGGLFRLSNEFVLFQTPEFISYNRQNRMFPSDLLLEIQEDQQNNLWVLSEESIVKFDEQNNSFESFGQFRGFRTDRFSGHSLIRRYSGDLVAGTDDGFYSFKPSEITTTEYAPSIVFTRFLLFNKEQDIHQENSPIHQDVSALSEITLEHNQSVFSIGYAALDYRFPEHIQYAYKLEPFETEWNYVGTQRLATYTNLPKGEYRFLVKSTNSEGTWYDNEREIKIHVLPSFWESGWAYCLYALLLVFMLAVAAIVYRLRTKMKMEQEISDSKLQFFTDISHELRTPLTLINAPLENVLENGSINEEDRKQLEVVHTNASRMLRMMNQILDFRKIQSNKMRLKVEKTNFGQFVSSCSANFLRLAENRNIQFKIDDETNGATYWVDKDKVDTIMFNLLSNAFKFTPEGKKVTVKIEVKEGKGVIVVSDEGCGMPKDKLSIIFDRYTTLQDYSLTKQSGTGIGLSLVKEIVDMHRATIQVESEENKGSVFTIAFLPGIEHFDNTTDIIVKEEPEENNGEEESSVSMVSTKESMTLLIVEDNDQMREFLRSVLQKRFTVIEAANGKLGYEAAMRELPNFIITDIMMPEMDGIEMTKMIRENEQTSHIPIVLLTAKTDLQSKIDCMNIGANDYITKPFNMPYLEARINNILEERRRWQEKYRESLIQSGMSNKTVEINQEDENEDIQSDIEGEPLNVKDDELMRQFIEVIESNMDNVSFTVEDAQDALKVSRWHLLSKVKSLVGQTPMEFIRETRLTRAAKLIEEGNYTMTQITYMIGMSDSRYFSRCFKQKYGMTPTEYKESKENNLKQ